MSINQDLKTIHQALKVAIVVTMEATDIMDNLDSFEPTQVQLCVQIRHKRDGKSVQKGFSKITNFLSRQFRINLGHQSRIYVFNVSERFKNLF